MIDDPDSAGTLPLSALAVDGLTVDPAIVAVRLGEPGPRHPVHLRLADELLAHELASVGLVVEGLGLRKFVQEDLRGHPEAGLVAYLDIARRAVLPKPTWLPRLRRKPRVEWLWTELGEVLENQDAVIITGSCVKAGDPLTPPPPWRV